MPGVPLGLSGQSAFDMHGCELALLHTSHRHLRLPEPPARQFGLAALSVSVCVPVAVGKVMLKLPAFAPGSGGQSRLVLPNTSLTPLTVHACPARGPLSHVPDTQCGHGCATVPVGCTRESSETTERDVP